MSRWRHARASADNTHHDLDGAPLYTYRFDEALSFHEPGLAAAAAPTAASPGAATSKTAA